MVRKMGCFVSSVKSYALLLASQYLCHLVAKFSDISSELKEDKDRSKAIF